MSDETRMAVENALRAHLTDDERLGSGTLITGWVVGYSTVEDKDGEASYGTGYVASANSTPTSDVGLARWVARQIEEDGTPVHLNEDEDDL